MQLAHRRPTERDHQRTSRAAAGGRPGAHPKCALRKSCRVAVAWGSLGCCPGSPAASVRSATVKGELCISARGSARVGVPELARAWGQRLPATVVQLDVVSQNVCTVGKILELPAGGLLLVLYKGSLGPTTTTARHWQNWGIVHPPRRRKPPNSVRKPPETLGNLSETLRKPRKIWRPPCGEGPANAVELLSSWFKITKTGA